MSSILLRAVSILKKFWLSGLNWLKKMQYQQTLLDITVYFASANGFSRKVYISCNWVVLLVFHRLFAKRDYIYFSEINFRWNLTNLPLNCVTQESILNQKIIG